MEEQAEIELLEGAANALNATTNAAFKVEPDLQARAIFMEIDKRRVKLKTRIEPHLTRTKLGLVKAKYFTDAHIENTNYILLARYVNPAIAATLKDELHIEFIDTVGNAYINRPPLYVYVTGNKPPERLGQDRPQGRMFMPAGIKVLFALFCDPELLNAPYREIAKCAGTAPTGITPLFRDMKQAGYLLEKKTQGRQFLRKKELFQRWVAAFNERVRPKLVRKRVCRQETTDRNWWKHADLQPLGACWGGEIAGAKLTDYLVPAHYTIYKTGPLGRLQLTFKLEDDPAGDVDIMEPFWGELPAACQGGVVHPVLAYAELLGTNDVRAIETAEIIYEQKLARLIGED